MLNSDSNDKDFRRFLEKYQKVPVVEYPNNVLNAIPKPVVSCRISTYQHAPYIRQCIEGMLMQKTDFPYEIVIGEDSSSDGTREICIEYAKANPDKIRLFLHHRDNNIRINGRPSARFQGTYTKSMCRGEFLTVCEGDDYWSNDHKIQLQYHYLKSHPECKLVFTAGVVEKIKGRRKIIQYNLVAPIDQNHYLSNTYEMLTASLMYSRMVLCTPTEKWMDSSFAGDFIIRCRALVIGKIGYVDKITCVYRKNTAGSWSRRTQSKETIKKEYMDNLRAIGYLKRYANPDLRSLTIKKRRLRTATEYKIAQMLGFRLGIFYLLHWKRLNFRNIVVYIKNAVLPNY